jgi:hypothetical protein
VLVSVQVNIDRIKITRGLGDKRHTESKKADQTGDDGSDKRFHWGAFSAVTII